MSLSMNINNFAEYIWEIQNFSTLNRYQLSSKFYTQDNKHEFFLYLNVETKDLKDFFIIELRLTSRKKIQVRFSISLLNQNNEHKFTNVNQATFSEQNFRPDVSGFYLIKRQFLTNSENGLLINDKLKIYCKAEVLESKELAVDLVGNLIEKISFNNSFVDSNLTTNLNSLLESCKHSDVVFVIGEKQFKLHKAILSARSPVFSAMFDSELEENKQNRVEIIDVDAEVFEQLVSFIYTGRICLTEKYAFELFVASDKYQFEVLKEECEKVLGNKLCLETVADVLVLADMHTASELKSKCVDFIVKNASKVMATDGWKLMAKTKHHLVLELFQAIALKAEPFLK